MREAEEVLFEFDQFFQSDNYTQLIYDYQVGFFHYKVSFHESFMTFFTSRKKAKMQSMPPRYFKLPEAEFQLK